MRIRTIAAAGLAGLLLAATACGASQTEKEDRCYEAIKNRPEGDKSKPGACNDLSEDVYSTLLLGWVLEKEGLDEVSEHPEDLLDYAEDGDVDRQSSEP